MFLTLIGCYEQIWNLKVHAHKSHSRTQRQIHARLGRQSGSVIQQKTTQYQTIFFYKISKNALFHTFIIVINFHSFIDFCLLIILVFFITID